MSVDLYDVALPMDDERRRLYIDGEYVMKGGAITAPRGSTLDFGTYFNLFSLKKWQGMTSLTEVSLSLQIDGAYQISFYGFTASGLKDLRQIEGEGDFSAHFSAEELSAPDMLGFRLTVKSEAFTFTGGKWQGDFISRRDLTMGIVICTFKREEYVRRNLKVLSRLAEKLPGLSVMVVDNGRTLGKSTAPHIEILPNPNYGGSGGFTRGLMEQVTRGSDYALLMDDDVLIEPSAIERTYSFISHLKEEYAERILSGAMLSMEQPTMQFENTAYWSRIKMYPLGRGVDLSRRESLMANDRLPQKPNQYGAWWYSCIPTALVKKMGYPLPVFIKGDDMEYGIRSGHAPITMNGIGVWHMSFQKKENTTVNFFNDRNMLIVHQYAKGSNKYTFLLLAIARLTRRAMHRDWKGVLVYRLALKEYAKGLEGLTQIAGDEYFSQARGLSFNGSPIKAYLWSLVDAVKFFFKYDSLHEKYLSFRKKQLSDQSFWRRYLAMSSTAKESIH